MRRPGRRPNYLEAEDITNWEETADYVVFIDGSYTVAINGSTGEEDSRNISAATVIQYALDNLTSGRSHKEKVLVKGNFTLDDQITIPSYTILEINGKLTLDDSVFKTMIINDDTTNGNTDIEIRGGILDGNMANNISGAYSGGIILKGCIRAIIEGVTVTNTYSNGISTDQSSDGTQSKDIIVIHCNVYSLNGDGGIRIFKTEHFTVDSNTIYDCYHGIFLYLCDYGTVSSNVIRDGNGADNLDGGIGSGSGISIGQTVTFVSIVGNTIKTITQSVTDDSGGVGIGVNASFSISIMGNTITNCDSDGIITIGNNEAALIIGNEIKNNVRGAGTHSEIKLNDNYGKNIVMGNFVCETGGTRCDYLINIAGAGSDGNKIIGNYLHGVPAGREFNNNSGTGIVRFNDSYITENGGAAAAVADGGTIAHGLDATPTYVSIIGSVAGDLISVSALDGNNITLAIKDEGGAAGTAQTIYWRAWV